ncbi:hypothetical protein [Saccharopolyspora spinosa]|uniref:hypothetical protein n=1 Tax=Saccharopolyspora spinosa TaxID=60894 RepID=UPI000237A9FC|nr:hypothetical protein [Saccharopolyspora spinosa]
MEHFQPTGRTAEIAAHDGPFHRMLNGFHGVVLHIESVTAKFRYGDNKSVSLQDPAARRLVERDGPRDRATAAKQRSRMWRRAES